MSAERPTPVTDDLLRGWPLPAPGEDKEARGRTLVVGGTAHTPGAVLLAGEAVLRAGAGKLQIVTAEPVAAALAVAVPEALVVPLPTDDHGNVTADAAERVLELAEHADTVLLGPGFSDVRATVALLERVVPELRCPVVLDAVGSAYIGEHREAVAHLDGQAVLTLNPGELAKTLGVDDDAVEEDPVGTTRRLARQTSAVVVLGGRGKTVATPGGRSWTSATGGPGLGVSGSGDVQAGVVAGLLGRGAAPDQAAVWGAHLHGSAGDLLARDVGTVGFLAREIPPRVPTLLDRLCSTGSVGTAGQASVSAGEATSSGAGGR